MTHENIKIITLGEFSIVKKTILAKYIDIILDINIIWEIMFLSYSILCFYNIFDNIFEYDYQFYIVIHLYKYIV